MTDRMTDRMTDSTTDSTMMASWDERYREGRDHWELGRPAPPLEAFLRNDPRAPQPSGRVLVPGCGRGHEARLLAELGFAAIGLDVSAEAITRARQAHGSDPPGLHWVRANVLDAAALPPAGLAPASLTGVLEHTCFCALDPADREPYLDTVVRCLAPGGWLLGLFWCHARPGGPPWGSDPEALAARLSALGLRPDVWEPAQGSVPERDNEWLGLWRKAVRDPGDA
jgi:SAM-dependent methyltransferase